MIEHSLRIEFCEERGLQEQLREALIGSILGGRFVPDETLPSCRSLSERLGVSRNTVSLVYEGLRDEGYLISRPRSGYFVDPRYQPTSAVPIEVQEGEVAPDWGSRLRLHPSELVAVTKPARWMQYRYPFIYGQPDSAHFPMEQWRAAARQVMGGCRDHEWLYDQVDQDNPMLIEQLRTRVLPKRGILAGADEILLTLGTQNALSLIAQLLIGAGTRIGVENPGFREAVNTFTLQQAQVVPHEVDGEGIVLRPASSACDCWYVTPSHQAPTGVSMSDARRRQLLQHAERHDQFIIEDDFDSETNIEAYPRPALKASDGSGRVIYVSSLSKALAPGLRLGFLVASAELVDELRALRRLMYRHPPANIQYQMAHFLAQGHYDSFLRRYREESARRWETLDTALERHLSGCVRNQSRASAFWLRAPEGVDTQRLAWRAAHNGVLIEPGVHHFLDEAPARHYFRLGFHAIEEEAIVPGVRLLAEALDKEIGRSGLTV
ncbi:PLP-dependent aminotransferase family protein [Aeromonas taiwanensis]|uniref:MocR-like pyridoxine biosynthesis transcription factor PdxR n=1 Tax=Aeromonas taiwanensis TaxID=633417 RepID=UPI00398973B4